MPIYRVFATQGGPERYGQLIRTVKNVAGLLLTVAAFATVGLYLLDDQSQSTFHRVTNALWNTVNTLTTMGDYTDLDLRQKFFLMVFMIVLLAVGTYSVSSLAGILSSPEVVTFRENRRMEKRLDQLSGHVIVAGFGAIGALVAGQLRERGETVLIVDDGEEAAESAAAAGFLVVRGMAEHEETLQAARVDSAKAMLIEVAEPGEIGRRLSMTLMARALGPNLYISVLSPASGGDKWFRHAGASEVLHLDSLIAVAVVERYAKASAAPAAGPDAPSSPARTGSS